jgi:hypothetical protein
MSTDLTLTRAQAAAVAEVLEAWSSPDDWGVSSLYVNTIRELLAKLTDGGDPATLAADAHNVKGHVHCSVSCDGHPEDPDWDDDVHCPSLVNRS